MVVVSQAELPEETEGHRRIFRMLSGAARSQEVMLEREKQMWEISGQIFKSMEYF